MRPTLLSFDLFGIDFDFHAYVVTISIAFLVCTLNAVRENYNRPNPYPITPIVGLWIFIGAFIGARAYWILEYGAAKEELWGTQIHWYEAFFIWQPGLVFYGGLIGGVIAGVAYMRILRVPLLPMGDIAFPWLPLGIAITRIGCFLNGCCWGKPTNAPWAIAFPPGSAVYGVHKDQGLLEAGATATAHLHPTQLYNVGGQLIAFVIMYALYKKLRASGSNRYEGAIMFLFPLLYGIIRFNTEIYRGDYDVYRFGMSNSHIFSLGLVLFSFLAYACLWYTKWRHQDEEPPAEATPENIE